MKILGPHQKIFSPLSLTNNTYFYFLSFIFQSAYSTSNQTYLIVIIEQLKNKKNV